MTVHFIVTKKGKDRQQKRFVRSRKSRSRTEAHALSRSIQVMSLDQRIDPPILRVISSRRRYDSVRLRVQCRNKFDTTWIDRDNSWAFVRLRLFRDMAEFTFLEKVSQQAVFLLMLSIPPSSRYFPRVKVVTFLGLRVNCRLMLTPIIAYGAASFHHTGRGESNGPVKRVYGACHKHYKIMLVNEHLTTKVHHVCGQRLNPIASRAAGGAQEEGVAIRHTTSCGE